MSGSTGSSGSAICAQGAIRLGRANPNTEWLLAHELGHHISGHCGEGIQNEMEANAAAIRVLEAWGTSEGYAGAPRSTSSASSVVWLGRSRATTTAPSTVTSGAGSPSIRRATLRATR